MFSWGQGGGGIPSPNLTPKAGHLNIVLARGMGISQPKIEMSGQVQRD